MLETGMSLSVGGHRLERGHGGTVPGTGMGLSVDMVAQCQGWAWP